MKPFFAVENFNFSLINQLDISYFTKMPLCSTIEQEL